MQRFVAVTAITAVVVLAACDNHGTTSITAAPNAGMTRASAPATAAIPQVIASGLSFPTALRLGPDGALYVSNFGYGPPNMGQLLRVTP